MSLASRFTGNERTPAITCSKYESLQGSRRCIHYMDGGTCALPDEFVCIEWQKANAGRPVTALPVPPAPTPPAAPTAQPAVQPETKPTKRDVLGDPLPKELPKIAKEKEEPPAQETNPPVAAGGPILVRGITDADIASFKALNVEVCFTSEEIGDVWLVPSLTGQDRNELTIEHAATITAVCSTFPGARVVAFSKRADKKESTL